MLSTGSHGNPEKLAQRRGLRPDADTATPAQPEANAPPGSQAPATHRALGHDIQVLKGPIESEVSAHRRPRLDALCGVGVPITSWAQVHLRAETTRPGSHGHGHRPRRPSPTMKQFIGRLSVGRQGRSPHPGRGQKGDQKGWGVTVRQRPPLGRGAWAGDMSRFPSSASGVIGVAQSRLSPQQPVPSRPRGGAQYFLCTHPVQLPLTVTQESNSVSILHGHCHSCELNPWPLQNWRGFQGDTAGHGAGRVV